MCPSDTSASSSDSEQSSKRPTNSSFSSSPPISIIQKPHQDICYQRCNHTDTSRRTESSSSASSSIAKMFLHIVLGSLLGLAVVGGSVFFPFVLAPMAASKTYHAAFYKYSNDDPNKPHAFDNTAWTYGTDYFLAACMAAMIVQINTRHSLTRRMAWQSRGLLACYMMSVLAGGIAHQFYTTIDQRNTTSFRILWTICVGTVMAASAFMGPIGSELIRLQQEQQQQQQGITFAVPHIPVCFWWAYGTCATAVCVYGGLSFQRPACDIFIAGITQSPSTFYMMTVLWTSLPTTSITRQTRWIGIFGFIWNAPLLPLYPLLVQYTDWSLAGINTLLHMWLLSAWGLQGLTLARVEQALARDAVPPPAAVPMMTMTTNKKAMKLS